MIEYPDKLQLAMLPTPLEPLDRLSETLPGPRIWVKRDDLTGCATTGNKIRKLEFTLAKAIGQGADTLITFGGVQSNHCRATALLGARLGLKVHLILRGSKPDSVADGNLFLDQMAGAEISFYEPRHYQQALPELMQHWREHYSAQGRHVYCIPTGASDGVGVWGYIDCARELAGQIASQNISAAAITLATGSGGTQAGLTVGAEIYQLGIPVIGMAVCDDAAYFQRKVREDLVAWQADYQTSIDVEALTIQVNDQYIGPGYAVAERPVFETIRQVAELEGLLLDPVYTGKAFYGLLSEISKGSFDGQSDVIFIHTGGVFGLMAQRDAF